MWKLLLLLPVLLFLALLAALYFAQGSLVFPARLAGGTRSLPPGSERLAFEAPDGERLHGVRIAARPHGGGPRPLLLGFGGNAWNAEDAALFIADLFPEHDVATFHYRGYRPSTGRPSAAALMRDAPLLHDEIVRRYRPASVVAIGFSIGTGVAARLARERPVAGLVLVTPFDSLSAAVAAHYRWAPVRLLFRHDFPAAEDLARTRVPVAILAAGRDDLVLPGRTEALRRRLPNLVFHHSFPASGHNDVYRHPSFPAAMREALAAVAGH